MLFAPTGRLLVANVAIPEEFTVPFPSSVTPFRKFTLPSGDPVGIGLTVAVNVTDCPKVAGFTDEVSAVVVTAVTISVSALEVEVVYPVLPE